MLLPICFNFINSEFQGVAMSVEHSSDLDWEDDWDGNELSDEQIKALLQKAEQQLLKTSPNQHIAGLKPNYQYIIAVPKETY